MHWLNYILERLGSRKRPEYASAILYQSTQSYAGGIVRGVLLGLVKCWIKTTGISGPSL